MDDRRGWAKARTAWEKDVLGPTLEKMPERKAAFLTLSGLPAERLYTPTDLAGPDLLETVGFPGQPPFTRGVSPAMYRQQFWIFGMYSGFGTAEEANTRFRYLLDQGQTGFSIALDLPTQIGYDPDHPLARGEVGKVGVSLTSLEDMERLFGGIPFEKVRQIRTTANAIGPVFAAMVVAMARKAGVDARQIRLFIQNDVLKEYIARGTFIYRPGPSLKHSVDLVEYCATAGLDTWTPLAISGYHIRDAGATAVQELAISLANGIAYFDEATRRGVDINRFAPGIWAFLSSDIYFLEEVGKFRAARRLWSRLMRERYGATDPDAMALKIFAFTLGGWLMAQQPLNNGVRVAVMTLAAALGGVQTLHTTSYDEAYATPTEEAATLALRTQQVIAHETGVTDMVDALGGSWALERLTDQIEQAVTDLMTGIEQRGGSVACIEDGWYQRQLVDAAYRYQMEVENGDRTVVGVNAYETEEQTRFPVFKVDPAVEPRQVQRVGELRERRDSRRVAKALEALEEAARQGENTVGPIIRAVQAYATVGEICGCLAEVYGRHRAPALF